MINSFLLAFSMYSKIPVPGPDWSEEKMKYVMCFFPLVGVPIGLLICGFGILAAHLALPDLMRSAVLTLIPLVVTGGIHMDGLIDTGDALASCQPRERKLEILKDSHTGAFAVIYAGMYLVACLGMWSGISGRAMAVMAVSFVYSRALSGMAAVTFRNARGSGLLAVFSGSAEKYVTRAVLALYLAAAAAVMILLSPRTGAFAAASGLLAFVYYRVKSYREFGGITGDLAGWFVQICELFMGIAVVIAEVLW